MIAVAGPRIDPAQFPTHPGLEVRGYVDRLYRHLCVCDLAVVQGGLTTTMELAAAKRPFLYFPLGHHFEQNFHVRHRLDRYGAGRCMDYATTDPDHLAAAITDTSAGRRPTATSRPTVPPRRPTHRRAHLTTRAERQAFLLGCEEPASGRRRRVAADRPAKPDRPAVGGSGRTSAPQVAAYRSSLIVAVSARRRRAPVGTSTLGWPPSPRSLGARGGFRRSRGQFVDAVQESFGDRRWR